VVDESPGLWLQRVRQPRNGSTIRRMNRMGPVSWISTGRVLASMLAALIAGAVITVAAAAWAWGWSSDFDTEIAAATMVFTAAAVGIALLAGLVAVAAFWQAIQRPSLLLQVEVAAGNRAFEPGQRLPGGGPPPMLATQVGFIVQVRLGNRSNYSGRNPSVRLTFHDFTGLVPELEANKGGWAMMPSSRAGEMTFQWDGGSDLSIHGPNWFRDLPPFGVRDSTVKAGDAPRMTIEAVTDGGRATKMQDPQTGALTDIEAVDLSDYTRDWVYEYRPALEAAEGHKGPYKSAPSKTRIDAANRT